MDLIRETKVRLQGYKLNDYNATYEECVFLYKEQVFPNQKNIRLTDINTGQEFIAIMPLKRGDKNGTERRRKNASAQNSRVR